MGGDVINSTAPAQGYQGLGAFVAHERTAPADGNHHQDHMRTRMASRRGMAPDNVGLNG